MKTKLRLKKGTEATELLKLGFVDTGLDYYELCLEFNWSYIRYYYKTKEFKRYLITANFTGIDNSATDIFIMNILNNDVQYYQLKQIVFDKGFSKILELTKIKELENDE